VEDLAAAANVVRGKKVANGVEFYVSAASAEVQKASEQNGNWQALLDAGARPLPSGCGPCIGLGTGLLEDGEVGISATNRNFKGRMGSRNALAYLASPEVVAASALSGYIDLPGEIETVEPKFSIIENKKATGSNPSVSIIDAFPPEIEGNALFCYQDNLNTDGIYPGKYTYIDDFTPEQQAGVVMENYDPEFGKLVNDGDIVVGGFNFGTGSSREQAVTALKYRGIRLVLAGSFSETYKRNALNNGFLALEAPELVNDLKAQYGEDKLTVATGRPIKIDFTKSSLIFDNKTYSISTVGAAAQELVVVGGLENWVKDNLQ
jgi:homoaconitate hydratase